MRPPFAMRRGAPTGSKLASDRPSMMHRSSRPTAATAASHAAGASSAAPRSSTSGRRAASPAPPPPPSPPPLDVAPLSTQQVLDFERNGWLVTRHQLPKADVLELGAALERATTERRLDALRQRVRVLCGGERAAAVVKDEASALKLLRGHDVGFLQHFHLHRAEPAVARVALGAPLAAAAAQLLGVRRVRLYQSCVFAKEPGFSETNWHSDLRMAPFDTNQFVTAWIPTRPMAAGGAKDSSLLFCSGSHRDFALPFWHDMRGRDLEDRGYTLKSTGPMALGDVSWHHGWTLHCAGRQPPGSRPRLALAVSFFADGARLLSRRDPSTFRHALHDEDAESYADWLAALSDGARAAHALLPVVWPQPQQQAGAGTAAAPPQQQPRKPQR